MFGITPYRRNNWSPANIIRDMDEFEKSFFGGRCMPAFGTDVTENEDGYLLQTDLPGFSKEEIKIEVNGDVLTVSAEHKSQDEQKDSDRFVRRERTYGRYTRSFEVTDVDLDRITAKYENGVLSLNLPKKAEVKPETRSIAID
ncbi:MAG: Hsp20/alpha crystallin family protein [Clostridia bacterium]|nr:Hsp20/alpha crystallin family protein [Clostridia bacterium]